MPVWWVVSVADVVGWCCWVPWQLVALVVTGCCVGTVVLCCAHGNQVMELTLHTSSNVV